MSKPRRIRAQRVLCADGSVRPAVIEIEGAAISSVSFCAAAADEGWLVLPGMVDLHGDAFEKQLMPRGGVRFPYPLAIDETDSQLVANGITTAFHGLTVSWEPGLRGREAGEDFIREFAAMRPFLRADTYLHLRFEIYAIELVERAAEWLQAGLVHLLAFNDHTEYIAERIASKPEAMHRYSDRTGLTPEDYRAALQRARERRMEVSDGVKRLASIAKALGLPMASHDDESPAMRAFYAELGCGICEFPVDRETARFAYEQGATTVFGAPNVLRGGSHVGRLSAMEAIHEGWCTALSTDYYYPSLLKAAFRAPFPASWDLVSKNPAHAAGLNGRGEIAEGKRADLIFVDDSNPLLPRVVATVAAGRLVYARAAGPWGEFA